MPAAPARSAAMTAKYGPAARPTSPMRMAANEPKFREQQDQFGGETAGREPLAQDRQRTVGAAVHDKDDLQPPAQPAIHFLQGFQQPRQRGLVIIDGNDQRVEGGRMGAIAGVAVGVGDARPLLRSQGAGAISAHRSDCIAHIVDLDLGHFREARERENLALGRFGAGRSTVAPGDRPGRAGDGRASDNGRRWRCPLLQPLPDLVAAGVPGDAEMGDEVPPGSVRGAAPSRWRPRGTGRQSRDADRSKHPGAGVFAVRWRPAVRPAGCYARPAGRPDISRPSHTAGDSDAAGVSACW